MADIHDYNESEFLVQISKSYLKACTMRVPTGFLIAFEKLLLLLLFECECGPIQRMIRKEARGQLMELGLPLYLT